MARVEYWTRLSRARNTVVLIVALIIAFFGSTTSVRADDLCQALITSHLGYPCNGYTVETPDGFLLGMYNIPSDPLGQPVLLFHGFQAGGDNFFWNSPEQSLGTILANRGYDVWIANARNIQWSHGNTKYSYNDLQYWDWTWDEVGAYDVVSSVEFVYNMRGGKQLFYVGHSQGTLTLIAALTDNAAQTAKIRGQLRAVVFLAPFTYNSHVTAPLNRAMLAGFADAIPPLLGVGAVAANQIVDLVCNNTVQGCINLIDGLLGADGYINRTRLDFYLQYFPQVTSSKTFNHYGQLMRSGVFQKYDKGPLGNLASYGQLTPPLYDFSLFPTDLGFQVFSGGIDGLADPADTQHMFASLPSGVQMEAHYLPDYGHLDFVIGVRANIDVYAPLLSFLSIH